MDNEIIVRQPLEHGTDDEMDEEERDGEDMDSNDQDDREPENKNPEEEEATISTIVDDAELCTDSDADYGIIEALDPLDDDIDFDGLEGEEQDHEEPEDGKSDEQEATISTATEDGQTLNCTKAGSSKTKKRRCAAVVIDPRVPELKSQANFTLHGTFYKRKFVGETSGSQVASEIVIGNTVEELLRSVWNIAKPFLCREVIFVDGSEVQHPTWADCEPSYEDMNKFIIMQDQAQKRRVTIDKVDSKLLVNWRSKDIKIHIHIYSTSVSCKSLWDLADKQLIRPQNADRAGAPNNQTVTCLANTLREKHGMHFSGHSSAWRLWANYIHSSPAHEQDRRMDELPPPYLLKFFNSVPISPAVKLDAARSGLSVASTINDGFAAELAKLESDADHLILLAQSLKQRITGMQTRLCINSSLVTAMQDSVRPEENELSQMLAGNVSDMPDLDHL